MTIEIQPDCDEIGDVLDFFFIYLSIELIFVLFLESVPDWLTDEDQ